VSGDEPRIEVRAASPGEEEPISQSLAEAFWDDPVQAFLLPDEKSRTRRMLGLFTVLLRGHYLKLGETYIVPDHSGAAMWAPPGKAVLPFTAVIRHSPAMLKALGTRSLLALQVLSAIEKQHPKEPHWYLGVLGTRPDRQGKGIGSALMQPILERCDAEGVPAYLESSKESNVAFYRRHGFEVTGTINLAKGGPPVWPMWREPRPDH
jgi:ribosomal protein S18 acetylase RimI-like enzyme